MNARPASWREAGLGRGRVLFTLVLVGAAVAVFSRTGFPHLHGAEQSTNGGGLFGEASPSSGDAAQANVRGAVPAVEAFFAAHGTYLGLGDPVQGIASYDPASAAVVVVASASAGSYCIQSTAGTQTFSKRGPAGDVIPGPC
jgi:hypothetical protein